MEPEQARELHAEFKLNLKKIVGGYKPGVYKELMAKIQTKLTPEELLNAKDIMDIVDDLKKNGTIAIGNYEYLRKVFNAFDKDVVRTIIDPIENQIQAILTKDDNMQGGKVDRGK